MLKCNKKILKRLKQKKKGFTLLEIVVALAVMGIMIIPLGGALLTSVKTNKMGEIKQESKLVSQEIIEKIRSFGDIKDSMTFNVGKEQGDSISITKDSSNNKLYNVIGSLTDSEGATMVEGTITEQGDLKEDFGSTKYLNEKFGLFIYIQNHKENNKISIYKSSGKTIDEYLKDTPIETIENCMELKIEVGDASSKEKLVVNGINMGSLVSTDITRGNLGEIGIYVEEPREVNDLVSLHLNNKNTKKDDKVQLYFFNNKLHDISHDEINDPRTDSFKRDRYINGEFEIFDNITYYKETERLNKGLYTITLEFRKKIPNGTTVTEKTQSEFMVDN